MTAFWVKFAAPVSHGKGRVAIGCMEASDEDAVRAAAAVMFGQVPTSIQRLPYPAEPRLLVDQHPKYGACPSLCFAPTECAGNSSCPKRYACSE